MTWLPRTAGLVAMISSAGAVHADEPSAPPARPTPSGTTLGLGLTADTQADGRWGLAPEAHGHVQRAIGAGFSLRVGGRLAFGGLTQAEAPRDLALREYDVALAGTAGLMRRGPVWPALTVGGGVIGRAIRFTAGDLEMTGGPPLDRNELLPFVDATLSVGLPAAGGALVLEPFVRARWCVGDARQGLAWGLALAMRID